MLSISFYEDSGHACILDTVLLRSSHGLKIAFMRQPFDEDLKDCRTSSSLPICMHGIVSYRRECYNLESFAAGSPYSTPALQQMSQVYQCRCGQRAEKPAGSRSGPTAESSTALVNARSMEYSRHDEVCYEPLI